MTEQAVKVGLTSDEFLEIVKFAAEEFSFYELSPIPLKNVAKMDAEVDFEPGRDDVVRMSLDVYLVGKQGKLSAFADVSRGQLLKCGRVPQHIVDLVKSKIESVHNDIKRSFGWGSK